MPRSSVPPLRRWVAGLVALQCAVSAPALARMGPGPADVSEVAEARGVQLANEDRWAEAAAALAEAFRGVPDEAARRGRRNQLAREAINAYRFAFEAANSNCAPLAAGISLADEFLSGLRVKYGNEASTAADHVGMSRLRDELEQMRVVHDCPASPEARQTAVRLLEPEPRWPAVALLEPEPSSSIVDMLEPESTSLAVALLESTPEPSSVGSPGATSEDWETLAAPTTDAPRRSRAPMFAAAAGVSAGLVVSMAIGAGILRWQLRKPGGDRYMAVAATAGLAGLSSDAGVDMCVAGDEVLAMRYACDAWRGGRSGAITMAALAGVFVATTAVFTGLAVRDRGRQRSAAQAWRRHQVQVGAVPRFGGAGLVAGFRF